MRRVAWIGLVAAGIAAAPQARAADAPASRTADEFVKAFNTGNARAVAAVWTADAEMVGIDGTATHGWDAIEKVYAGVFRARPGIKAEVETATVRPLGPTVAVLHGVLKLRIPETSETDVTVFRAVEVKEGDGWKLASVRSWVPDKNAGTLADLGWLVGEWTGKNADGEFRVGYGWDEGKAFLRCRYEVTKDGKVVTAGTQMIGSAPDGGVRGWLFDRSGATAESDWVKDGDRWVIRAAGTARGGTTGEATHLLVPVGKDAFTWQSLARTVDGVRVPDGKPVKLTRTAAK